MFFEEEFKALVFFFPKLDCVSNSVLDGMGPEVGRGVIQHRNPFLDSVIISVEIRQKYLPREKINFSGGARFYSWVTGKHAGAPRYRDPVP